MAAERRNDPDTSGKAGGTSNGLGREHDREVRQLERELNKRDLEINKRDLEINKRDLEINKRDLEINKRDLEINKLRKENLQLRKTVGELSRDVAGLKKIVAAFERRNKKMEEIILDQGARLDYYENAHVPPSRQGPFHKNVGGNGKSGEDGRGSSKNGNAPGGTGGTRAAGRGGVRGHRGGTRIFRPTGTVRHTAARCPGCKKTNIRDRKNDRKRRIVSIPEFVPHTVTLHRTARYRCLDCGGKFEAADGLPPHGQFYWSVIRYVSYQYGHRKTAGMIAEDLENLYGLEVSDETVREMFRRGARMLKPVRDGYMAELENSPAVIMDETDYEGEPKRWIMAVRNDDTVVYAHAQGRGAADLVSQAADCVGIITRDGYPGYDSVFPDNEKQRCTQHISREGRNISKRTRLETAVRLYEELSEKFGMLRRWTRGRHSAKTRLARVTKLQKWLRGIISGYKKSRHEKLKKFGTTLENAAPQLFTFVVYPFVHSTTSLGEQSIKPVIGQRNSRIQLKSDRGAESLCMMLSCTETWKLRGLNVWEELRRAISPSAVFAT